MLGVREKRTPLSILLVGEDKQQTVLHFGISDNSVQFPACLIYPIAVRRVDDKDQTLSACSTMLEFAT